MLLQSVVQYYPRSELLLMHEPYNNNNNNLAFCPKQVGVG
jgi:hypothetical protein